MYLEFSHDCFNIETVCFTFNFSSKSGILHLKKTMYILPKTQLTESIKSTLMHEVNELLVTKPLARLLEPLRIATILNIYLSNGM